MNPYALKPVRKRESLRRGDTASFRGSLGQEIGGSIWKDWDGSLRIGPFVVRSAEKAWSTDWEFVSGVNGFERPVPEGEVTLERELLGSGDFAIFAAISGMHVFWGDLVSDRIGGLGLGLYQVRHPEKGWVTTWQFLSGVIRR